MISKLLKVLKPSPMKSLVKQVLKSGFINQYKALELFAREGNWHTTDYARYMNSVEAWEIDPAYEANLRKNLPSAKIKITDTFKEISLVQEKFDFVVSDNSMSLYGNNDQYCEHFMLFPDVFRILMDQSVLVVNVIPKVYRENKVKYPYLFNPKQCELRKEFYKSETPEDISWEQLIGAYSDYASQNGFRVEKTIIKKRNFVYYLALFLKKE